MAVEAPQHLLNNNHPMMMMKMTMMMDAIDKQSNGIESLGCTGYRTLHLHLLSGTTTTTAETTLPPMYSSAFAHPDPVKAESDLTYGLPVSKKRCRDSSFMCPVFGDRSYVDRNLVDDCVGFTFLGEDISSQILQQQLEIDQFITRHVENVRANIEERRRRNTTKLITALEEGITQTLKAKEEEIAKMTKLNWALEEKLKSLCIENQIWRDLAQTNEATANALRSNLNQVLEQLMHDDYNHRGTTAGDDAAAAVAVADDAQSCCVLNNDDERTLAEQDSSNSMMRRLCKSCWKAESCVLLLPCRHLCLCRVCASSVDICPICKSSKNISVNVHMS